MKVKNSLFTSGYTAKYKHCRNKISSLTRLSKKLYHQAFFEANLNKMKKTWEGINTLIDPNKTNSKTVSALKRSNNNTVTQNPSEVTDILNRFFSSVGQTLADNIPSSNRHLSDYFGDQVYPNSFFFDPVTPSEIESENIINASKQSVWIILLSHSHFERRESHRVCCPGMRNNEHVGPNAGRRGVICDGK